MFIGFFILMADLFINAELKAILLATGDRYLLEFCRGAKRRELQGKQPERWSGLAEKQPDGRCYVFGDNTMGKLLMKIRQELRSTKK